MRRDLLHILCCPLCKGELELNVLEESGSELLEGSLRCPRCGVEYRISEGIPNLMPPEPERA